MRVLVTGGAGYIGSHVVRALQESGHAPLVLDNLSTGNATLAARNQVELIRGDVRDPELLDTLFSTHKPEAVIHVAGRAISSESVRKPDEYFSVNTFGGWQLLEAMRRHVVTKIVFSSTCAVYGVPEELPIREDCPRRPVSPYGESKLAFEFMLLAYARAYGFKTLALRYFNVAGASAKGDLGEIHHPETHLIPNLLRAARKHSSFRLYGTNYRTRDGTAERDYLHVEDLAHAHVMALERLEILDPLAFGGAVNLGTGQGATVREVLACVEHELSCELEVQELPRRPGDPPALVADSTLAERVLGFRCTHDLGSMVRSAMQFEGNESTRSGFLREDTEEKRGEESMSDSVERLRFGEYVVSKGYLSESEVEKALRIQRERDGIGESHKLLGMILLEMGAISNEQLIETLRNI